MASTLLFIIMTVIAAILLLTCSITSTIGASDAISSNQYGIDPRMNNAHQYLTISAALDWSSLVVLIVIISVAASQGALKIEFSKDFLNQKVFSKEDLAAAYKGERELSSENTLQITLIVIFVLLSIVIFTSGILSASAATQLSGVKTPDSAAISSYHYAITTAILGILSFSLLVIAIVSYFYFRKSRKDDAAKVNEIIKKTEEEAKKNTPTET